MNYLTYERYLKRGGKRELPVFERYKHRVFAIINNVTFGRVEKMKEIPSEVEVLCCDLIDYLSDTIIQSEEDQTKEIDKMVCDYLIMVEDDNGIPLLYRGCGR